MKFFIPLETAEPQTDAEFAGMTQVMNVHTRTVLAAETGDYLFPRSVAMVASNSLVLQDGIKKGWFAVLSVVESASEQAEEQTESKKRKKSSVTESAPEVEIEIPVTEPIAESDDQSSNEVAPQDNENSL